MGAMLPVNYQVVIKVSRSPAWAPTASVVDTVAPGTTQLRRNMRRRGAQCRSRASQPAVLPVSSPPRSVFYRAPSSACRSARIVARKR